jgi:mitochondrial import receptor subunit TOM22
MAPAEESDSGMESLSASSSKDLTPEKPTAGAVVAEIDSDDDDDEARFLSLRARQKSERLVLQDETVAERIWGLTEMFPDSMRHAAGFTCTTSVACTKGDNLTVETTIDMLKLLLHKLGAYSVLRATSWLFFSSAVILFAPIIFESERVQVEEMQKQQNRQVTHSFCAVIEKQNDILLALAAAAGAERSYGWRCSSLDASYE